MEQLINFIIRPPRAEYDPKHDLLDQEFTLKGKWYQRKDVEIVNSRRDVLQCSHYIPIVRPEGKALPCVIYCHGNSGCRTDASEAAIILLPSNITVFTLDFSGSGLSGGEHVTLGWNEKDDLRAVVEYLRADGDVSLIGLWGRSMGAVTSLMYGAADPSIAGMVLDSPFSDLVDLMMELVDTYKVRIPKFTVKFAIQYMRRAILKKAKFDIMELNTIKVAKCCFVPVLLGHAVDDDFIQPHHSDRIFDVYVGDKNIIKFEGDHNSPRPQFYFDSINIFFHNVLQPPEDEVGETFFGKTHDYLGNASWSTLHGAGYGDDYLTASIDPSASSTEDAIIQLRSKRPMSRTEVPPDISSKDKKPEAEAEAEAEEEGSGTKPIPSSSSKMISFEFSNGHPYGPHIPTSIDDEDYVEYPLDNLADFPSNEEEEERMFMEAVKESLKNLDIRHGLGEQPSNADISPDKAPPEEEPAQKLVVDHCVPSRTKSSVTSVSNGHNLTSELPSPDTSLSSKGPSPTTAPSSDGSGSTGASAGGDTSSNGVRSSSSSDMADSTKGTRATVTVEKSPSNNIIEGLRRRLDLNFFRNSR